MSKINLNGDFYAQDNNPTEALLKKFMGKLIKGWYETCGPTAACNCMAAFGYNLNIVAPSGIPNIIQPEEALSDMMNDPRFRAEREKVRAGVEKIPGGRVPQLYPWAVKKLFGAEANFSFGCVWGAIINLINLDRTIQVCLKKPGHYIAVVGYDRVKNEIIYKDSWLSNPMNKNGGVNERMSQADFEKNTYNYKVVYR